MYQSVGCNIDSLVMFGVACVEQATNPVEKSDQALISEVNRAVLKHYTDHNYKFPSSVEDLVAKGYLQEVPELESGKKIIIHNDGHLSLE